MLTFGRLVLRSSTDAIFCVANASPPMTEIATGVCCKLVSRFSAVTIISGKASAD